MFATSFVISLITKSTKDLIILTRDDVLIVRKIIDGPLRKRVSEKLRDDIRMASLEAAKKLTLKICTTVDYVVDRVINHTFKMSDKRAVDVIANYFNMPLAENDRDLPRYLSRLFDRIISGDMEWAILSAPSGYIDGAQFSGCNPMTIDDDSSGDEMYI